jgi:nucleoside-diphosphate-sugar epimerase
LEEERKSQSGNTKKINLVTGASGFLGSHLVAELIKRNENVRVLVRETSDISYLNQFNIDFAYGCLSDKEAVLKATKEVDTIFNCAAYVSDFGPYNPFEKANILGVQNLLESCLINKTNRLIHISTTDVYGFPKASVDETCTFRKRGFLYGDTKIEGEKIIWNFYNNYKIPITIFRPATIYGESKLQKAI